MAAPGKKLVISTVIGNDKKTFNIPNPVNNVQGEAVNDFVEAYGTVYNTSDPIVNDVYYETVTHTPINNQ